MKLFTEIKINGLLSFLDVEIFPENEKCFNERYF